ncbi:MAG TPA: T9SS type A sorting domain-containing protein [Firmicutes bacterium]|nr:T9SS type A sorting domain-containing protein [Bacillota bacterium]
MKRIAAAAVLLAFSGMIFANTLSDISFYDAGKYPRGITLGDFSGNGLNEILVANFGEPTLIGQNNENTPNSSLSLFSYSGEGFLMTLKEAGSSPRGLASGDIDGDGETDFVVTNYDDGTVMIFMGGDSAPEVIETGRHPVGAAIGYVDNNGIKKKDIAVAVYSDSKVLILTRNAKGIYTRTETAVPGNPTDVAIGEINGERIVVSANYTAGNVSIIKKTGPGIEKITDVRTGGGTCKVEIADVTGDGINNIIASNFHDNTITVIEYMNGEVKSTETYELAGSRPNGMAVGDVNGDGLLDVVAANRDSDSIDILIQKNGKLELVKSYTAADDEDKTYGPVEVAIGDVTGNGLADIVFTHMRSHSIGVIVQSLPAPPVIVSNTHPDQDLWYANPSPVFMIETQDDLNGIQGIYYMISGEEKPFNAKDAEYTAGLSVLVENLETGTWYFTAAVKDNAGNVSLPASYRVNITAEISEKNVYNFPNPADTETTIRFPVSGPQEVKIIILDSKGTPVWQKQLSPSEVAAGVNYVKWMLVNDTGRRVSNGIYMLRVITEDKVINKKIAVIR